MVLGGCNTQKNTDSSSQKEETQESKNQDISEESTDGEADESQEASKDVFAMDTYMTLTAYGENAKEAVEAGIAEIQRLDALLSTVQMPPGIPVASVAIDGAKNAAILAVEMLAIGDPELNRKLWDERKKAHDAVVEKDAKISAQFN